MNTNYLGAPAAGQEPATKKKGRYEDPQEIKKLDANPHVKSEKDLWKLKHLSWDYKSISPAAERIYSALDEQTRLEFIETPLGDVVEFLGDLHGIEIAIDTLSLGEEKITIDSPITANLTSNSLRNALDLILGNLELDYVVKKEVLFITTAQQTSVTLETRVYETRRLQGMTPEQLVGIIVSTVEPDSWHESAGLGRIEPLPGGLVVYQTQRMHDRIIDMLQQLLAHEENPLYKSPR